MQTINIKILNKEYAILFFNNENEGLFKVKCDIFLIPEKCRVLRGSLGIFGKQVNFCTKALIFTIYLGYDLSTCENIIHCLNDRENIIRRWNLFCNHFNGDWDKMHEFMIKFNSFDFDNPNSNPVIDSNANVMPNMFDNKPDEGSIDNLIEMAIASGDISEEVKNIIVRKAIEKLGIDKDEAEIIVSGKISLKLKSKSDNHTTNQIQTGNKEGVIIKCPACGEPTKSFTAACKACGHEFRSVGIRSTILILIQQLKEIEHLEWESNPYNGKNGQPALDHMVRNSIASKQSPLIDNFPIPNSKEEIFEFLSMALPIGQKKFSWAEQFTHAAEKHLSKSYLAKAQQAIIKGKMLLKDDKESIEQLKYYSQQLGL
jgi:hypothetical protein